MRLRIHCEERTGWAWWVHFLIIGLFIGIPVFVLLPEALKDGAGEMSALTASALLLLFLMLPFLLYAFLGQLRVRVTDRGVEAAWGLSEVFRRQFPFEEIVDAKAVTYSPLREFGGWGIRIGFGKRAWTTRGNRALVLHLTDDTRFYLSSEKPERLLISIQSAGSGKMGKDPETEPSGPHHGGG